ncbi:MAG: hypothetical protein M0R46_04880 [Candidatus Muirbacterium halophilum]|nr:hypothetical protein [Candidatus Muirbacterium halophilum]MCK9475230.1 hypothetical protein [Candidatus Muirbacterium halophilum]
MDFIELIMDNQLKVIISLTVTVTVASVIFKVYWKSIKNINKIKGNNNFSGIIILL